MKKIAYKGEKRFKWVLKDKKDEPRGLEEVGNIMNKDVIEDQPIKDDNLIVFASEKELKSNQPIIMEGDVEEEEFNTPRSWSIP